MRLVCLLLLVALPFATVAAAVPQDPISPVAFGEWRGGGWSGAAWSPPPLTPERLRAMVEMDGDPATLTEEEARMLEVLMQVLTGAPVPARAP